MINDPLVTITAEDLRAVLESRKLRKLPATYPASCPEVGQLPIDGRLWWLAESVNVARIAGNLGRPDDAREWLDRAARIAEAVAGVCVRDPRLLRQFSAALAGIAPAPEPDEFTPKERRMLIVLRLFVAKHGRRPACADLVRFLGTLQTKLKFGTAEASRFLNKFEEKKRARHLTRGRKSSGKAPKT